MAERRLNTLRELWKPKLVKVGGPVIAALAGYDAASNQLGLPKIGELLGMSGSLLPWWGWLLILQALFVYALFEYVRRLSARGGPLTLDQIAANGVLADVERLRERVDKLPELDHSDVDQLRGEVSEKVDLIFLRLGTVDRDLRNLLDAVGDRIGELQRNTVAETFQASDGRFAAIVKHFTEQIGALDASHKKVIGDYQTVLARLVQGDERHKALEIDLGDVRRGCASLQAKIDSNEAGFRESIHAVLAREELQQLAKEIQTAHNELFMPLTNGEKYDKARWQSWESIHAHWERSVKRWTDLARWYGKNVRARVLTVDDKEYDAVWPVDDAQFPNADAVRRFKRHRIIHVNWMKVSDEIKGDVRMVAHGSISEKELHGGKYHP